MPIWKKKDPSGPAGDIQKAAELMKTTWQKLQRSETHLRNLVKQVEAGRHITTAGAAQVLRGAADLLSETSTHLHDAARKIEPPPPTVRVTRRTPRV